ncbi:M56 family metallopeptidase [Flavobacterium ammonificans]|uniref:M56 family metallopeptidase n=1 Tax=Flavobacterium ammonificans TaxID=1751056 RepID=UPI001E5F9693|nr:M56 family metallopeptidase [Flavobacterium ammonificans]BDB57170.1 hypothetical protein SHINM13_14660 [Flavobacterium ammonificans]
MENFLLYFAKVNGLIIAFYLLYLVFLRKETFYVGNRWYLLSGLATAIVLPLITFTKTVWVDPEPISKYIEVVPLVDDTTIRTVTEEPMDWSLIFSSAYALVSVLIILKVGIEIASFFNKIIKLNKQKDTNFTLIYSNSTENPFSFFKYIVINPTLFSKEEYEHIVTHERIHVKQFHSIDVLISKVFCALFWINPIIWLYRKAMLQNLEFIADNHSLEQIESKYEYQKTLLKVVANQQSLSITNPFYQSLIKKRIIMLHTNQSHKRNAWKYATIIPVLVGFMLLFQIETIAQVKDNSKIVSYSVEVELDNLITSKTTDDEIKAIQKSFTTDEINLKINNVKRNKDGEIIAIRLELISKKNPKTKTVKEVRGNEPIKNIEIYNEKDEYNKNSIGFKEVSNIATASLIASETDSTDTPNLKQDRALIVNRSDSNNDIKITAIKSNSPSSINPETIIYLNDKEISKIEMDKINPKTIKSVDVKKEKSNGEIRIVTSYNDLNKDTEILLDDKVISYEELKKLDKNEIESINIKNNNGKKSIEILNKNAKAINDNSLKEVRYVPGTEEAKIELIKAKIELEKAKTEIEKAKIELEKAKLEIAKSKSKNKKK